MDPDQRRQDVFICHAGEQKLEFADLLHTWLTRVHQLRVFMDEHSLQIGCHAPSTMLQELRSAHVGVRLCMIMMHRNL